ncbi:AMP-binding protein [Actinokineospora fastidiosa]|uniref:AMP-binding protein n=1 Tax=Actinokineospora fastidiosa TaxID=1816 RepID=UPI00166FDE79|nr:AMP-binding protein [Actinokineospora fastidiosa]
MGGGGAVEAQEMNTVALLGHAARVFTGAGLVRPQHLGAMLRALRMTGPTPATLLRIAAAHHPDAPGVIDDAGMMTFGELDDAAARLAAGLAGEYGIRPQSTIAVLCRNHRGFVLATAAAGRLGANLVYLNTEFGEAQVGAACEATRADVLIADDEFPAPIGVPVAYESVVARLAAGPPPVRESRVRPGRITLLTSGTTGTPKGAPRTPTALGMLGPAVTLIERARLRVGEPMLIAPPLFHGFGLATWALAVLLRSPIVLRRRFDAEALLADVERHGVAFVAAVPIMLHRILALPPEVRSAYTTPALRAVLSGGSALRPELAERFRAEFGEVLLNGYGSSEIGIAAVAGPADLRAAAGTVGRPSLGVPVRVLDEQRRPVPAGVAGTVFVGGPLVFDGYTGGGTKEVVDGLMNTGDTGHLDPDGRLHIHGRADDMIISGGENVYPQEVEDALARHPAVADVAVFGTDDPEFGQRLVAYVVPRGEQPDPADLSHHVRTALARYKVPRDYVFLPELPRTATGKVRRSELP